MADLGSLGTESPGFTRAVLNQAPPSILRCIRCGDQYLSLGGKDTSQGNPSQPSLKMESKGLWRFRWAVSSGTRTVSVDAKQALNLSPRPTLVVKANASIGVNSDVTETAGGSAGWVTVGPATITPTSDGVVWVELRNNLDYQYKTAPCYWDNIATT